MKNKRIFSGIFILSLLFGMMSVTMGQDEDSLTLAGTLVTVPIFEALATELDDAGLMLDYSVLSTSAGIEALCAGDVAGVGSLRPLTVEEDALCRANDVTYIELLVGHHILALIAHPEDAFLGCMVRDEMNAIFAPSASVATNTWSDVNVSYPEEPLAVALTGDDTLTYVVLDRLVDGDGLRQDAFYGDAEAVVETVSATVGMIGVVPLHVALAYEGDITILEADFSEDGAGCAFPSVELVEGRFYGGAESVYLYVNQNDVEALGDFLGLLTSEAQAEVLAEAGYSAPSPVAYGLNAGILAGDESGRTFTQDVVGFEIPQNLSGIMTLAGNPIANTFIDTVVGSLTARFQALTVNTETLGESDGIRRFCNGEVGLAIVTAELDEEREALCEANDITPTYFPLGTRGVVMVANEADDFAICLTLEQIDTIWGASSTDVVMNWSDVGASFPDQSMTLFGINAGDVNSDLLLGREGQAIVPIRTDTELSNDALYRAAATANVAGALTYMSWTDYQRVLNNNQANIQLVSVNAGDGCVEPSEGSLEDGRYVLSQPVYVMVASSALNDMVTQSVLWWMFSEANFGALERAGLVGIGFADLPIVRNSLQDAFVAAAAIADEAMSEAMPEPEATEEAGEGNEE